MTDVNIVGESETAVDWLITIVGGFIVARFVIYVFRLDDRLRAAANWVRAVFGVP